MERNSVYVDKHMNNKLFYKANGKIFTFSYHYFFFMILSKLEFYKFDIKFGAVIYERTQPSEIYLYLGSSLGLYLSHTDYNLPYYL